LTNIQSLFRFISGTHEKDGITIVVRQPTNDIITFTLYGNEIERTIAESIALRAIDQKGFADYTTESVFTLLFKNPIHIKYNVYVSIKRDEIIANLRKFLIQKKSTKKLIEEFQKREDELVKAEIDGQIFLRGVDSKSDWVEMKLYTCPPGDPLSSLRNHLQLNALQRYFAINDYLALMGFSYIRDEHTDNPLSHHTDGKYSEGIDSVWAINISFISSDILNDGLNSPQRAALIYDAVNENLDELSQKLGLKAKSLFFQNTINLVKVHHMGQYMESYRRTNEELKRELKRSEEEKEAIRQEKEAIRQEKEAIRQENEKYRKLLIEKGIIKEDE
jgi:hypothetical protein